MDETHNCPSILSSSIVLQSGGILDYISQILL